ncbi:MAG TPA: response regulator transcription factor [Prolixibacteraceae bacterium]|nr:response regulator transcription factor [Prolixibacteraceae bacterium]
MDRKISLMLVDDHQLFREGLKLLLQDNPFIENIYQAANGKEFLKLVETVLPDVVLMDIDMPEMDGIEATRQALKNRPELKIIALSMFGEEEYYLKMIEAGAMGFILKNSDIEVVEKAIRNVVAGQNYFSSDMIANLVVHFNQKKTDESKNELTERESEILYHICKGMSNQEIADALFLSKRTVDKHRENILFKTNAKNTAQLVMYAIKNGIVKI